MTVPYIYKLDGSFNFRDLGGYPTTDGRQVRSGLLFRSDDLVDLSDRDMNKLEGLGIRSVVDFRDQGETVISPDRLPHSVVNRFHLPIEAGKLMGGFSDGKLTAEKARSIMLSVYRALAHDFQDSYRQFFKLVANTENIPLLFHCTAGKDRTGFAAALLLSALGVERKIAMDDYMVSRDCLRAKYRIGEDYDPVLEPLFSVEPAFLDAAFAVIDSDFGGMDSYLANQIGVKREHLVEMLTEPKQ